MDLADSPAADRLLPSGKRRTLPARAKPATVEGGYELAVPLFINEGDTIRINTETGEYNDRTATR